MKSSAKFAKSNRLHISVVVLIALLVLPIANVPAVFSAPLASTVTIPNLVGFEGYLTNGSGQPISDGPHDLGFRVYYVSTGGTAQWTETQTITVTTGLYSALLGSVQPLTTNLFNGNSWIGVTVDMTGTEITPRTQVASAPFALNAAHANSAESAPWLGLSGVPGPLSFLASPSPCSSGQVPTWNGSTWACQTAGTLTGVTAGAGLTGGGTSGNPTLAVATGGIATGMLANTAVSSAKIANGAVGSAQVDSTAVQLRVTGTCTTGIVSISSSGSTVTCGPYPFPFTAYEVLPTSISTSHYVFAGTSPSTGNLTITSWLQGFYVATTNNSSNNWAIGLRKLSNIGVDITNFHTSDNGYGANTSYQWSNTSLNLSLAASDIGLTIYVSKTGSPGALTLLAPAIWVK